MGARMSHGGHTVTAVVITKNEEAHLHECLASVIDWVDEVVILDSGSTDRTKEIAEGFGARFYQNPEWPGFGRQRQIAQEYVTSDWCFWLDADERVGLELRDEILSVVRQGTGKNVYAIPRLNWFFGRFIRHCGWYPKPVVRLYPTALTSYDDSAVHEQVEVLHSFRVETLKKDLIHYPYTDLRQYVAKSSLYANNWAKMKAAAGKRSSLAGAFSRAILRFFRMYLFQKGMLDGKQGFLLCVLSSYYTFLKYAELWALGQDNKNGVRNWQRPERGE
jgi:(heptosyl)LPS beta-1,4-glucosyltransferase